MDSAPMYPYLVLTVPFIILMQRFNINLPTMTLSGLKIFVLPEKDQLASTAVSGSELALLSKKQQKRLERSKRQQVSPGTESMMMYITDSAYIRGMMNYNLLDNVMMFLVFYVLNWVLSMGARHYMQAPGNPALEIFAFVIMLTGLYALAEVEIMWDYTLHSEKLVMYMTGLFTTLATALLLLLGPQYLLDFQVDRAARDLSSGLSKFVASALKTRPSMAHLAPAEGVQLVDGIAVAAALAVMAGVIAGLTLGGTMRWGKMVLLAMHPPVFAAPYFSTGAAMQALLRLALVSPALTVVLWAKPLTEFLGLTPETLHWLQPTSAIVSSLLMLMSVRKLMQAFFITNLVDWWLLKHCGADGAADALAGPRMRIRNQFSNNFAALKVALQLSVPALVLFTSGTVHLYSALPAANSTSAHFQAPVFVRTWAGFLCWWTSLWWFLVTSATVGLQRMGFYEITSR